MGKGAVTALLEIYAESIESLKRTIAPITDEQLIKVCDDQTSNPDCISIQTILAHVVYAGFGYATTISNRNGDLNSRPPKILLTNARLYCIALDDVRRFTVDVFNEIFDEDLETCDESEKMLTGWKQRYDIEQLMEHAIVHVLRHDRQIKIFLSR